MTPLNPGLTLRDATLGSALEQWAHRTGVKVEVNWVALERAGVSRGQTLTLATPDGVTAWAELNLILYAAGEKARLGHHLEEGSVTVSTREDLARNVEVVVYDIRPLLARPYPPAAEISAVQAQQLEALAQPVIEQIRRSVEPDLWKDNGGSIGAMSVLNGQLVVTATPEMHVQIRLLLERLE